MYKIIGIGKTMMFFILKLPYIYLHLLQFLFSVEQPIQSLLDSLKRMAGNLRLLLLIKESFLNKIFFWGKQLRNRLIKIIRTKIFLKMIILKIN